MIRTIAIIVCLSVFGLASGLEAAESTVVYNRDVRPLLNKNCFVCHGLDEESREAGLRLDLREAAVAELDSGTIAIVPGNPEESEFVARITSDDESIMPPPESHKSLAPEEIELLIRWIEQGAPYEQHWSLTPPQKTAPPQVESPEGDLSPIDAFVLSRLEQEGLKPARRADRHTLIRRLSLDLTGLPPSPAEVRAFVSDERPDAYQRLVDRLLASPHFGERMAVSWLDFARYADTHGYHIDSHRDMWAWRDWVIQAFNENMSFDEFTIWQLAGDLLPDATTEQLIASGFNRNHGINFEGGAIPEEYLVEYVVDRVNTTGTVWLGMTLGCARCHDHKYDAISQKEYFEMFAFFNTIDEKGLDGERGNAEPKLQLPNKQQESEQKQLINSIDSLEKQLSDWNKRLESEQEQWELQAGELDHAQKPAGYKDSLWYGLPPIIEETVAEVLAADHVTGGHSIDIDEKLEINGKPREWVAMTSMVDGHPHNFIFERSANYLTRTISVDEPQTVTISVGCTDGLKLWFNGRKLVDRDAAMPRPTRQQEFTLELTPGENHFFAKVVNISWECQFYFAMRGVAKQLPASITEILAIPRTDREVDQKDKLQAFYRENIVTDSAYHKLRNQLADDKRRLDVLNSQIPTTMVMREMSQPRSTFRLDRGQYNSPQEEVTATTPSMLPALPSEGPRNRLVLAEWLTDASHPLTARVAVNRLWQMLFGTGIVSTTEDLGTQGEWPTHPDLLDWLGVEFIESGWDVKHMLRLMVMSKTYQQASASTPEKLDRDPYNRLLSHGPRFRLQAEFVRDVALKVSGLLNPAIGGPSVKTYQPPGMWRELAHQKDNSKFTAQIYEQSTGDALYRRSLYTFWKRSVPPPTLVAFDAPTRETCTVRRETTNTPLQALVLLNDPTFVEASRQLAQRMIHEAPNSPEEQAKHGFFLTISREPTDRELSILLKNYEQRLAEYQADPEAAEKLLNVGESPIEENIDSAQHAAWTCVASMLLNLDETITKE